MSSSPSEGWRVWQRWSGLPGWALLSAWALLAIQFGLFRYVYMKNRGLAGRPAICGALAALVPIISTYLVIRYAQARGKTPELAMGEKQ